MKTGFASTRFLAVIPFTLFFLPAVAWAQQMPVTGQMMGQGSTVAPTARTASAAPQASATATAPLNSRAAASSPASQRAMGAPPPPAYVASADTVPPAAAAARPHSTIVGETTHDLLQMQADGAQAGKHLPMLGAEASASYDRYIKSFSHEIPEFYKTTVGKDSNGSAGSE